MTVTLNSVVNVMKRVSPMAVTLIRQVPDFTPVTLNPLPVSLTEQFAVLVVATMARPWDDLPRGALIVNDLPTFTDLATGGNVGFWGAKVVEAACAAGVVGDVPPPARGVVVDVVDVGEEGRDEDSVPMEVVSRTSSMILHESCAVSGCTALGGHGV